mgnify:CR=1 FL=1
MLSRQYTTKSKTKRGPERNRVDDGTRVLSIKFKEPEYARLKNLSVETGTPMKELLRQACLQVYGEPTAEDIKILRESEAEAAKPAFDPWAPVSFCTTQVIPASQAKPQSKKAADEDIAGELFKA